MASSFRDSGESQTPREAEGPGEAPGLLVLLEGEPLEETPGRAQPGARSPHGESGAPIFLMSFTSSPGSGSPGSHGAEGLHPEAPRKGPVVQAPQQDLRGSHGLPALPTHPGEARAAATALGLPLSDTLGPSRSSRATRGRSRERWETKRQERSGATCSGDISTVSGSEHHNWDPRSTTQQLRDVTSLGHSSLTMKGLKTILATGESL
ncbi:hypothetical protein QTO34_011104 [Cnephaeus nilssonii]|uniref:Uncharacterized protein n=1 Tax=Cnephaeus nilssonii TaxID=3371016 RepID=A0AA40LED9_CNENI|nr:hypothetical protein QTO34_011104 [Eptesicus nilssonii]